MNSFSFNHYPAKNYQAYFQTNSSSQDMCCMQAAVCLAEEMGTGMG
jgi:hypothetical protein